MDEEDEIIEEETVFEVQGPASGGYGDTFEEDDDDEEDVSSAPAAAGYEQKGIADRMLVDQQAHGYDEMKQKKRAELDTMKARRNSLALELSIKERELGVLEQAMKKDQYLETRERVQREREAPEREESVRAADGEPESAGVAHAREALEKKALHTTAAREVTRLKLEIDEVVRMIASLERELSRL